MQNRSPSSQTSEIIDQIDDFLHQSGLNANENSPVSTSASIEVSNITPTASPGSGFSMIKGTSAAATFQSQKCNISPISSITSLPTPSMSPLTTFSGISTSVSSLQGPSSPLFAFQHSSSSPAHLEYSAPSLVGSPQQHSTYLHHQTPPLSSVCVWDKHQQVYYPTSTQSGGNIPLLYESETMTSSRSSLSPASSSTVITFNTNYGSSEARTMGWGFPSPASSMTEVSSWLNAFSNSPPYHTSNTNSSADTMAFNGGVHDSSTLLNNNDYQEQPRLHSTHPPRVGNNSSMEIAQLLTDFSDRDSSINSRQASYSSEGESPFSFEVFKSVPANSRALKSTDTSSEKGSAKKKKIPHKCDLCGKTYSRIYDLRRHLQSHGGAKPFTCPLCGRKFSRQDTMLMHQRGPICQSKQG